jgi:hypothetical protein
MPISRGKPLDKILCTQDFAEELLEKKKVEKDAQSVLYVADIATFFFTMNSKKHSSQKEASNKYL